MTTTSSSSVSAASSSKPSHLLHITTATNPTNPTSSSSSITQTSSRSPRIGVGTGGGGQNQACAACKYQRRKCSPDCPLAPYFPADQQRRFLNAHRLFGVSNIQRTLRRTDPELRPDAMRALVFQAEARALDPVGGCFRIVAELEAQLHFANDELDGVLRYLALCRQQAAALADPLADPAMLLAPGAAPDQDDVVVDDYADQGTADQAAVVQAGGVQDHFVLKDEEQRPPHQLYDYFYYDGTAGDESIGHAWSNVDNVQQHYGNGDSGLKARSPVALSEQLAQHCQIEAPFVDAFDVKQELPTTMEHDGKADVDQQEEKVVASAKSLDVDREGPQIAESSSAAAAHCQLELGFSSF